MDDLTSEFLVETNESLDALDNDLINLEQNPDDSEIINNIFRVMHTIKGTCGFLGLPRLEGVAHSAENIMDKIRDGVFGVNPDIVSLILEAIDRIKEIIEVLEETGSEPEGDDSELKEKLDACADSGGAIAGVSAAPDSNAEAEPAVAEGSKTPDLDGEIDFEPVLAPGAEDTPAVAEGSKTPDLDGEIDFEPVLAPGAEAEPAVAEGSKTPDLDGEIDFEPVLAPGAEDTPAVAEEISQQAKTEAVTEGLKESENEPAKKATASAVQSIRVGIDVLENLMQMVGELVLTRNQLLQMTRNTGDSDSEFNTPLQRLNIITSELQEGVMQTRMQPIGNAWAKFPRLIRDLAIDLSKKMELKMVGAETEIDRQMLEAIKDPLTHMVRNSADHGVDTPEERIAAGKSEVGTVTLSAYHEGGHVLIKISDDGRGLNVDKIKAKALENGLTTEAELSAMTEKQIYKFVFKPGFSTAEKVTAVSGRGVGMDVVVSNIEKIGGTVDLESTPGKGSEFIITLPLTLAIMPVLIIESGREMFAVPQIRVSEIVRAERNKKSKGPDGEDDDSIGYTIETINDSPVLRLRGRLLPLVSLSKTLQFANSQLSDNDNITIEPEEPESEKAEVEEGVKNDEAVSSEQTAVAEEAVPEKEEVKEEAIADEKAVPEKEEVKEEKVDTPVEKEEEKNNLVASKDGIKEPFVVVCEVGSQSFGIMVEKVFHTEEIVVKPVADLMKSLEVYSGCTILGDGSVIMILDPNGIIKTSGVTSSMRETKDEDAEKQKANDRMVSFLVFKAWGNAPRAVPLELVSRLEEIDMATVEWSGKNRVVQYREGLMRIISLDDTIEFPKEGVHEVVVFADGDKVMGVLAEEIVDIVKEEMDIKSMAGKDGLLGSLVINDLTTDLIDISFFFDNVFSDWSGDDGKRSSVSSSAEGDNGKKHVLLIDDSPFFRKFMKPVLLVADYQVTTADNAAEALEILDKNHTEIDIVVTDIDMPEMTGIDFLYECKKEPRYKDMPFIALTSHSEDDLGDSIKDFNGFVTKSDRDKLVAEINQVLTSLSNEAAA